MKVYFERSLSQTPWFPLSPEPPLSQLTKNTDLGWFLVGFFFFFLFFWDLLSLLQVLAMSESPCRSVQTGKSVQDTEPRNGTEEMMTVKEISNLSWLSSGWWDLGGWRPWQEQLSLKVQSSGKGLTWGTQMGEERGKHFNFAFVSHYLIIC